MKWFRGVVAAAILVIFAAPAVAQEATGIGVHFRGVNGVHSNGFYVGNYLLQIPPVVGPTLDAYCVDFINAVTWNEKWTANITSLANVTGLETYSRWGQEYSSRPQEYENPGLAAQEGYRAAAYLAGQFAKNDPMGINDPWGRWGGLHSAIWHIFTPNAPGLWDPTPGLSNVTFSGSRDDVDLANWYVVTDKTTSGMNGGVQEYLVHVNVVPEPATIILMGTGLVAVMGMTIVMRQSLG